MSLTVVLTEDGDHVIIHIKLPGDAMPEIIVAAETVIDTTNTHKTPGQVNQALAGLLYVPPERLVQDAHGCWVCSDGRSGSFGMHTAGGETAVHRGTRASGDGAS